MGGDPGVYYAWTDWFCGWCFEHYELKEEAMQCECRLDKGEWEDVEH